MPDPTMEAVARAIAKEAEYSRCLDSWPKCPALDDVSDCECRAQARAAIAAYQSTIHESSETRGEDCAHESATGITEYAGPEKIWRCDGCGYLYASYTDDDGITVDYPVLSPIRSGGEGS